MAQRTINFSEIVQAVNQSTDQKDAKINEILAWGIEVGTLENAIEQELSGTKRLISIGVMKLISSLGLSISLMPISSKDETGFVLLYSLLTRIFS